MRAGILKTLVLVLAVWLGAILSAALLQVWMGESRLLYLAALLIAGTFTAVAVFDEIWRRR